MRRFVESVVTIAFVVGLAACGARKHHQTIQQQGESFRYELAELYVAKGAHEAAVPLLGRILEETPDDVRARVLYGVVLRDQGLHPQAEAQLRRALSLDDERADAHAALAILLDLTGRHAQAVKHHRRAVKLAPRSADFQNNLGYSLLAAGDASAAIPPLELALALDPALPHGYANLGFAYGLAGRLDDAARVFRAGLPEAAALYNLAMVHDERGDAERALELRDQAFALDPDLRPLSE